MVKIEAKVKDEGKWIQNPSVAQANEMYECGKESIQVPQMTHKQRRRRLAQMSWTTVAKILRGRAVPNQ